MKTNSLSFGPRTFLSALAWTQPHRRTRRSALLLSSALCLLSSVLCPPLSARAANFPGNARVEAADATGGLSWRTNVNALTVQCWFKLSIPSGVSLTENMTILVNRRTGTTANPHAYHFYYDRTARDIRFSTRGNSGLWQGVVIRQPYLDRWYHLAVVRSGNSLIAYVDGQAVTNVSLTVGNSQSTDGVSIGGWANANHLYGEVQEVTVYQSALTDAMIRSRLFEADQSAFENLVGYYRLGYSANPVAFYMNAAPNKPAGTDGVKAGPGQILFEETNQKGEQSLFDSQINGGRNAVVPLSGAFTWQNSVFTRPVPGVPFDFSIVYSPSTPAGVLGAGWNHTFNSRVEPVPGANTWKLLTWQGGVETWDGAADLGPFQTRHGEYRGELARVSNAEIEWTNAARMVYRHFSQDDTNVLAKGQLAEIRDLNGNSLQVLWNKAEGRITNVVDSAGGNYRFHYSPQNLLTNLVHGDWQVRFTYTNLTVGGQPQQYLASKTLTNTSGIYSNVSTTLRFFYNTNGLLERIVDARGHTNVLVRYDEFGRQIETVNALGHATRRAYGVPDKRQITTTDAEGFRWIETYDRKGRIIAQQDPLGQVTRFTYDDQGNRISVTDPLGSTSWLAYDNRGNVLAQTNALGEVSHATYHPFLNKPLTETDPLGWVTTNTYDAKGNLFSRRDALGTLETYTYTPRGLLATATDANGNTNRFEYNADGFRVQETDAAGFTRLIRPNDIGWTLAITNALGEVTTYAYDVNGNTVRTVDPLGRVYAGTYDANGNLLTQTDPKGQQARYTYDALNQKTSEVDRGGGTNRFAYTPRGSPLAVTNALGRATLFYYDAANRETNTVDALGHSVRTIYDANGNAIAMVDPVGQRWTKVLDRLNRTVAVTDPVGNTTRTLFDAAGRIRETITPEGESTTHRYDGRGRMIERTDAAGSVWRYDYDGVGNLTNIADALGGRYVMVYGPRNERILERNQDGKEWHYTYDALLRLKTQQEPNGNSETIEYDAGSRIVAVNYSTGRVNSFFYDDNDNPVVLSRSGSGPATISQLAYDASDRVQQYTDAFNKTIRYQYDTAGRLTSLTYPDGKVLTNRYDALDRLTEQVFQFSAQQAFTNAYAYDPMGRLIRRGYPNGIVQTNTFDVVGRLTGLAHAALPPHAAKLNVTFGFAFDRNGNTIQSKAQGAFAWPMPAPRHEDTRFTPAARIIDRSITLTGATNPQSSVLTYHYDPSGNMTNAVGAGQTWTLTYDEENRTTSIHWDSGLTAKTIVNRYDALGRRIARTVDGILTGYVLDLAGDRERILCDLDASRTITAWYVHGADLTFKVSPDGSLTCYHPDAHGNIIALTDSQANTLAEYAYTPFGRSLGSAHYNGPVANPYLFGGSQGVMEELPGLYFMRARYYSADAGVFLSTDPVKNIGPSWVPLAYAYAENNPLRFNDPDGEFFNFIAAAVGAVVGAVVNAVVEVVTQLIENKGDFGAMNWGKVGIAAGVGAVQGAIAGLTGGASIVAQIAIGAAVGGVASVVQTGLGNLTEGKAFAESWQSVAIDFGLGAATGAIPGGGKPKAGVKAPKAPGVKPTLARARTNVPSPKVPKLTRSLSAPAVLIKEGASQSASQSAITWRGQAWDATREFVWGVSSGIGADKLNDFLQQQ